MSRSPRRRGLFVALFGVIVGSVVTGLLGSPEAAADTRAYGEVLGFSLTTPAGIVVFTYIAGEFDFDGYYGERANAAMFADFLFGIGAGAIAGLLSAALALEFGVDAASFLMYTITGISTFTVAVVVFFARTREFLSLDEE